MPLDALDQLQELALTDAALRQALDAASNPGDLLGLARLHNLELSEATAQAWLESSSGPSPSVEMLAAISQGLSACDEDESVKGLTEEDLEGIAGGGGFTLGEALLGEALLGEAA
ncbi:MAG: hypothetical protein NTZ53_01340 [Cyanobacteria bacterium]|nr:hypothetical protein [Cyanobacteriota bacterium]